MDNRTSLLIIDDSTLIRERLAELFLDKPSIGPVFQAKDSTEAMSLFTRHKPGLVILDIRIPGDNGIKILEKIKAEESNARIIMLTNYPYEQYRNICLKLGADYFFSKAEEIDRVVELCCELSENRERKV